MNLNNQSKDFLLLNYCDFKYCLPLKRCSEYATKKNIEAFWLEMGFIFQIVVYHKNLTDWSNLFGKLMLISNSRFFVLAIKVLSSSICSRVSSISWSIYVFCGLSLLLFFVNNFFIMSLYVSWQFQPKIVYCFSNLIVLYL